MNFFNRLKEVGEVAKGYMEGGPAGAAAAAGRETLKNIKQRQLRHMQMKLQKQNLAGYEQGPWRPAFPAWQQHRQYAMAGYEPSAGLVPPPAINDKTLRSTSYTLGEMGGASWWDRMSPTEKTVGGLALVAVAWFAIK